MGRLYQGGTFGADLTTPAATAPNAIEATVPLQVRPLVGTRWLIAAVQIKLGAFLTSGGVNQLANSITAAIIAGPVAIGSVDLVPAGVGYAGLLWRGTLTPPQPAEVAGDSLSLLIDATPTSAILAGAAYTLTVLAANSSILFSGELDRAA